MNKKQIEKKEDYHGIEPINSIVKKMKKHYDKDSKEWRIISNLDKKGNTDTFIEKKPNTYWLKSKALNPYSALSMGTVIKNLDKEIDEKIGKEFSPNDALRLFGMAVPINRNKNIVAAGIEKYSQSHGDHIKQIISEQKPNVGYQMARKIDRKFRKRYPQRDNLYL
jgi:hypothetical protein